MISWILYIFLFILYEGEGYENDIYITIPQGTLLGVVEYTDELRAYNRWSGIPYASPPVGARRFREPFKPYTWDGVRNATVEGNACRSRHMVTSDFVGSEDCLYLNIYAPKVPLGKYLPVMVWIHGGSFYMGSGTSYRFGPKFFMEKDVVLVTINYRLGPLGFLNLDIPEAPGNAGLKDQVAALLWIKENIKYFGGNNESITVFGESAGGASAHYLTLSPVTKGLFHKAIIQSGVAINEWAFERNPRMKAIELCKELNHTFVDPQSALDFLLTLPAQTILEAGERVSNAEQAKRGIMNDIVFGPSKEKKFPGQKAFITRHPLAILQDGDFQQVPVMLGYTDGEGTMLMTPYLENPDLYKEIDKHFEKYIPIDLDPTTAVPKIKQFYFNNKPLSKEFQDAFTDYITDHVFSYKIYKTAQLHASLSSEPVYFYRFAFDEISYFKSLYNIDLPKACHADELLYLFNNQILDFPNTPGSNVDITQKRMMHLWTTFAKYGNPTRVKSELIPHEWERVTKRKMHYLNIGETLEPDMDPDKDRMKFWEELYSLSGSELHDDTEDSLARRLLHRKNGGSSDIVIIVS